MPKPSSASAAVSSPNPTLVPLRRRQVPTIVATDGERLMRFRQHRDEAAFREVVDAHAALVWGVCWQVLRHRQDVEDAFQATFLILARKGGGIRAADSAAGWLYRVAFRTALAARQRRRRLGVEPLADDPPGSLEDQLASIERSEQCETLLEELHALADRYRQPLVLCYLEGRSRQETADELGLSLASVKGRLARGLRVLRTRLASRGLALSSVAAVLTTEMAAAQSSVAAAPVLQTAALGASFAWSAPTVGAEASTAGTMTVGALTLANKGILAMKIAAAAKPALGLLAVGMTAGALAIAQADPPRLAATVDGAVVELVAGEGAAPVVDGVVAAVDVTAQIQDVDSGAPAVEPPLPGIDHVAEVQDVNVNVDLTVDEAVDHVVEDVLVTELQDVLVTMPAGSSEPVVQPYPPTQPGPGADSPRLDVVMSGLHAMSLPDVSALVATTVAGNPGDGAALELEMEYWTLKGRGLQKKSEAMRSKSRALAQSGAGTQIEVLELEADADLALAEVKLCEARARQIKSSLERLQAGATSRPSADVLLQRVAAAAQVASPAQPTLNPLNPGPALMPTPGPTITAAPAMPAAELPAAPVPAATITPGAPAVPGVPPAAGAPSGPVAPSLVVPAAVPRTPAIAAPPMASTATAEQTALMMAQRAAIEAQYAELRAHIAELQKAKAELQKQLDELRRQRETPID